MKQNLLFIKKVGYMFIFVMLVTHAVPTIAKAAIDDPGTPGSPGSPSNKSEIDDPGPAGKADPSGEKTAQKDPVKLTNPLSGIGSINELLSALLKVVVTIATPIVIFFIILSGFKYVTARGDATKVGEATRALTYAVIGGVLIIGASAIGVIISGLVDAFK